MAIRKSKINIDTEERCDFDNMIFVVAGGIGMIIAQNYGK